MDAGALNTRAGRVDIKSLPPPAAPSYGSWTKRPCACKDAPARQWAGGSTMADRIAATWIGELTKGLPPTAPGLEIDEIGKQGWNLLHGEDRKSTRLNS